MFKFQNTIWVVRLVVWFFIAVGLPHLLKSLGIITASNEGGLRDWIISITFAIATGLLLKYLSKQSKN